MKSLKIIVVFIIAVAVFTCCNTTPTRPDNAMDTGRMFIRASLDGDFKTAEMLLLKDTLNMQYFQSYKQFYNKLAADKKENYKNASYEINSYKDINDSSSLINYSNSYMNKPLDIRVQKINNTWLVDFKYTYGGNQPVN
ncbi:MAG: hypothetical protein ABIT96_02220 [Ferruginibacter sp.]